MNIDITYDESFSLMWAIQSKRNDAIGYARLFNTGTYSRRYWLDTARNLQNILVRVKHAML